MQSLQKPRGILLIGGKDSNYDGLSSVEVFGLGNCSVPDLPEWRYDHGSFITGGPPTVSFSTQPQNSGSVGFLVMSLAALFLEL